MSAVKMTFAISKSAAKLVKAGKAILSSGGVRDLTGQMIEMVKPVAPVASKAKLSLNPVLGGINLASSIGSNIQCAFIQQGVNAANAKLDDVMVRLEKMSRALSSLQTVQTLSWIGTSFSLANCGISVAGFYLTLSRLDRINGQLKEFYDRYKQDRQNDKIMRFNEILDNLKSDIGMLRNRAVNKTFTEMDFKNDDPAITRLMNRKHLSSQLLMTLKMTELMAKWLALLYLRLLLFWRKRLMNSAVSIITFIILSITCMKNGFLSWIELIAKNSEMPSIVLFN